MNSRTTMNGRARGSAVMVATALSLISCGGGGGGDTQLAGIDRLGVSSGTITEFGSIFVNGVEWETGGADISVDDSIGSESELRLGQVVTVRGRLGDDGTSGTADSVEFDNEVEGPITTINAAASSFVVLGQTVITNPDTVFDDSIAGGFGGLVIGSAVEVSGQRDANGAIRATRVELRGAGADDEVKGVVSGLNTGNSTFLIGSLTVNYAGATLEDFGSDTLGNGDVVEVKGSVVGGVLVADTVEREDDLIGDDGDESEVEGYIKGIAKPAANVANFTVNGVPVTTNAGTEYEGGGYPDLVNDLKVEVEGEFNASGVLVADKVDIRVQAEDTDVELAGQVTSVNAPAGTLAIEGVVVRASATTLFEDKGPAELESFGLANINAGDYLEVRGAEDGSTTALNDMIATRVERDDFRDEAILRGPVQSVSQPELTVLGVTINTDSAVFRDLNDTPISEAAFFGVLQSGDVVKAKTAQVTDFLGTGLLAEEVEIEELD